MRRLLYIFLIFPFFLTAQVDTNASEEVARDVANAPGDSAPSGESEPSGDSTPSGESEPSGESSPSGDLETTEEELAARLSLNQVIENGGWLIYLLMAMSVAAAALVVYFLFALRPGRIAPASFVSKARVGFKANDLEGVRTLCAGNASPVAALASAAVEYLDRAGDEADSEMLRQVVEGEGVRQVGRLQSQVTYLMDIGVIAPMVGLLGTVMGMLRSFSSVALDIAKVKPMVLADGVSQALITTAAGLVVAIPAMMFYSLFRGRLAKLTANMELVAADFVTTLTHRNPQ